MILRQFLHSEPVAASYFLGCGGRGVAAVVDPVGDVALYLRVAKETGTRIRYVIDTHVQPITSLAAARSPMRRTPSMCCSPRRR